MVVGVILQVSAMKGYNAPVQWCVGRVVTGVGNGMNTATVSSLSTCSDDHAQIA